MKLKTLTCLLSLSLLSLSACHSNPLLEANDSLFIKTMDLREDRFFGVDCEAIFYGTDPKVTHSKKHREQCFNRVREGAVYFGIPKAVTLEHIQDPKVRDRYFEISLR